MQAIAAITLAYGFVSTSQFSHCYRAYVGQSPSQARLCGQTSKFGGN
ncbi:AraC family transcriptional regulator [Marinobacterium sedimentorum]|nr:AraC family transcriptional regulator [Marinobacterium sedimentorum]MCP8689616.1 AraC family transcriptional regulator [Marinobacterium sedimentorum]